MAVYTKPRSEKKVAERLEKSDLEVYCPTITTISQWSDRKKKVVLPVFSSYVFLKVSESDRAVALQDHGVMNFVYWLGKPAIIRDEEIEALRHNLDNHVVETEQLGDIIKITQGPFAGYEGEIQKVEKNKVIIFLQSLGMMVSIKK